LQVFRLISKICAANDCQDPEITKENISKYQPPTETIRFITIAVLMGFGFTGIMLHTIILPNITGIKNTKLQIIDDVIM